MKLPLTLSYSRNYFDDDDDDDFSMWVLILPMKLS